MKTMLPIGQKASFRPYWTAFRIRAQLETQYRGAALGGLVTQMFFGLVMIFLYEALFDGSNPALLRETVTYVWLQQMFFRLLMATDTELTQQILSGGIAYTLCRPVDQYGYWLSRSLAMKIVGALMRAFPMLAFQMVLPAELRMTPPDGWTGLIQFGFGLMLGVVALAEIENICAAVTMKTLDARGIAGMLRLVQMILAGNIIPLTLFPDSVQALLRYQPFAQALDAPTRMYLHAQSLPDWLLNTGMQLLWIILLGLLGRWMWARRLRNMTVQGG